MHKDKGMRAKYDFCIAITMAITIANAIVLQFLQANVEISQTVAKSIALVAIATAIRQQQLVMLYDIDRIADL